MSALAIETGTGAGSEELASFVTAVSTSPDVPAAMRAAAELANAAFSADLTVVTWGNTSVSTEPPPPWTSQGMGTSVRLECPEGGQLCVLRSAAPLSRSEEVLLGSMAKVLVMAVGLLENREQERALLASLQERQDLLERLARIQRSIFHRAPIADVLDIICDGAAELLGDDVIGLRLVDPNDPTHLVLVSSVGVGGAAADPSNWRTRIGQGIGGRAVSEGRLVVTEDYAAEPDQLAAFASEGVQAAMAAPVFEGGRIVGSLTIATHEVGRRYSEAERDVLQAFAEHASLALNDARTAAALRETLDRAVHQASHDGLTGLVNRTVILERLEERLARPEAEVAGLTVLFVDLDRFKLVNDSLGHDVGDKVLRATAERLQRCVRPGDVVGRHSGDEFVVICSGLNGEVDAMGLADRICHEIALPVSLRARDIVVTASVGIARAAAGTTAEQLLRDADVAMYQAKEHGRARTELFGTSMRARLVERVELEHALRRAILRDEFRLHYQPTVSLRTGRPQMVEALLRWDHPDRGLVRPDAFIPVAEDTGLIVPIGAWVLREACREVAEWRRRSPALAGMQVSVNLSARQFNDEHLVPLVASALEESGLDPSALWLEITETVVMAGVAETIDRLNDLKALGVRLSIDDFGTGYSSLSYLKRFPVDVLKIDRSFVDGVGTDGEDEAIVTAVIRLAHALGKRVVAEGIENEVQLAGLAALDCEAGQGFFFSRPEPPATIVPWLEERLTADA